MNAHCGTSAGSTLCGCVLCPDGWTSACRWFCPSRPVPRWEGAQGSGRTFPWPSSVRGDHPWTYHFKTEKRIQSSAQSHVGCRDRHNGASDCQMLEDTLVWYILMLISAFFLLLLMMMFPVLSLELSHFFSLAILGALLVFGGLTEIWRGWCILTLDFNHELWP